jgi:hypothetical protein
MSTQPRGKTPLAKSGKKKGVNPRVAAMVIAIVLIVIAFLGYRALAPSQIQSGPPDPVTGE